MLFNINLPVNAEYMPKTEILAESQVQVNTNTIFQTNIPSSKVRNIYSMRWDFGDGNKSGGPQVSHSFSTPGTYQVTVSPKIKGLNKEVGHSVFVYEKHCFGPVWATFKPSRPQKWMPLKILHKIQWVRCLEDQNKAIS